MKIAVALMLTFSAGVVDIVGFLTFYSTFTAHMTGVTVHLGQYVATHRGYDVEVLAGVLAAFVTGSIVGRTIVEVAAAKKMRTPAGLALFLEAAFILIVALIGNGDRPVVAMSLILAAAMGLQTASLTRVGPLTVHTTFVTGMLNKLAQLLSHALFLTFGGARSRAQQAVERPKVLRQAGFIFSIWFAYFVGAALGAWMRTEWGVHSLVLPGTMVAAVAIIDQVKPLSIEEERDQSER